MGPGGIYVVCGYPLSGDELREVVNRFEPQPEDADSFLLYQAAERLLRARRTKARIEFCVPRDDKTKHYILAVHQLYYAPYSDYTRIKVPDEKDEYKRIKEEAGIKSEYVRLVHGQVTNARQMNLASAPPYPRWVFDALGRYRDAPPSRENSLYGMWNAMLGTAFPAHDSFIVKPQGMLRESVGRVSSESTSTWATGDSYGAVYAGEALFPDFVVARCTRSYDRLLVVVEVKKDLAASTADELERLENYLRLATTYRSQLVEGMYVDGSLCYLYRMRDGDSKPERITPEPIPAGHLMVYEFMRIFAEGR